MAGTTARHSEKPYQVYKQEWKIDQRKVLEFENQLRMDKEMGKCYTDNETTTEAGKIIKEAKTNKEAQIAVDTWMQALESLPFIKWRQQGQWKRNAEDGQEKLKDESRYTTESDAVRISKALMGKTIK